MTYFKRFFLKVSLVEENPKHVMLAALFLAGKIEEERIAMDALLASCAGGALPAAPPRKRFLARGRQHPPPRC